MQHVFPWLTHFQVYAMVLKALNIYCTTSISIVLEPIINHFATNKHLFLYLHTCVHRGGHIVFHEPINAMYLMTYHGFGEWFKMASWYAYYDKLQGYC